MQGDSASTYLEHINKAIEAVLKGAEHSLLDRSA
jgi:hypothetical protein